MDSQAFVLAPGLQEHQPVHACMAPLDSPCVLLHARMEKEYSRTAYHNFGYITLGQGGCLWYCLRIDNHIVNDELYSRKFIRHL